MRRELLLPPPSRSALRPYRADACPAHLPLRRASTAERGLATVEYLIVLTCTILGAAFAAKAVGPHLVLMLLETSAWLSLPVP